MVAKQGADWHLAGCLVTFFDQLDRRFPRRDTASDGSIGDARHRKGGGSDHNPSPSKGRTHVVKAGDVDVDGVPMAQLVEDFRKLGASGDTRLRGGYVIFNSRIAGTHTRWEWRAYTGPNKHTKHAHFSVGDNTAWIESTRPWDLPVFRAPGKAPAKTRAGLHKAHPTPVLGIGARGDAVRRLQEDLNRKNARVTVDGEFERGTQGQVIAFQRAAGLTADGVVGAETWKRLHAGV